MSLYRYKALSPKGLVTVGFCRAETKIEAQHILEQLGNILISLKAYPSIFLVYYKIKHKEIIQLCLDLQMLDKAGIPLLEALQYLNLNASRTRVKSILDQLCTDIESGLPLSTALQKHPYAFDSIFTTLIKIGEQTGGYHFSLQKIIMHLQWLDETQSQLLKAMRYPLIIFLILLVLISILISELFPALIIFLGHNRELPFMLKCFARVRDFVNDLSPITISTVFGVVIVCVMGVTLWLRKMELLIPIVGRFQRYLSYARFYHVLGVMSESGIEILSALALAKDTLSLLFIKSKIDYAQEQIYQGQCLSQALENTKLFPAIIIQMLRVGEKSNHLGESFYHVKNYYESRLKQMTERVLSLIEPSLLLVMGGIIVAIIMAVFIPFYDMTSLFEG